MWLSCLKSSISSSFTTKSIAQSFGPDTGSLLTWFPARSPGISHVLTLVLLSYWQCFSISDLLPCVCHLSLSFLHLHELCPMFGTPAPCKLCLLTPPHASKFNSEAIPFGKPTVSLLLRCLRHSEHNLHLLIITCQDDHQSTLPSPMSIRLWKEPTKFSARTWVAWNKPHSQFLLHWGHWDWKLTSDNCYLGQIKRGERAPLFQENS